MVAESVSACQSIVQQRLKTRVQNRAYPYATAIKLKNYCFRLCMHHSREQMHVPSSCGNLGFDSSWQMVIFDCMCMHSNYSNVIALFLHLTGQELGAIQSSLLAINSHWGTILIRKLSPKFARLRRISRQSAVHKNRQDMCFDSLSQIKKMTGSSSQVGGRPSEDLKLLQLCWHFWNVF